MTCTTALSTQMEGTAVIIRMYKSSMTSTARKIITGDWDGTPIWRYETSGERLADELQKEAELRIQREIEEAE